MAKSTSSGRGSRSTVSPPSGKHTPRPALFEVKKIGPYDPKNPPGSKPKNSG